MPNTGRFYAPPAAAAAYRDRYMRPYSTVSPPMGGAGLINTPTMGGVAKGSGAPPGSASYARSSGFVRRAVATDSDMHANAYESRVRSRPAALYEEDRPWHHGYPEKQFARAQHHAWSEEDDDVSVSVRRGASLSASSVSLRSNEMARHHRIASAPAYDAPTSRASFDSAPCPSTLPRLSSLLKRSPGDSGNFDDEEQIVTRKRLREASPRRDDFEHEPKMNRRFYEEDVFADHRAPTKYSRGAWGADERAEENRPMRQTVSMPMKNSGSFMSAAQDPVGPRTQISPLASSSRQFAERSRYPYINNEVNMTSSSEPTRRLSAAHEDHLAVRPRYDNPPRAYELSRRNYYTSEEHRNEPSPVGLKSPPPTAAARDRFSPIGRYSESKDADSVIEAAADLVEERSPSKRESITKLLLKSKEFLKAKSLVRNRNNEIDWVATFLNVGFESNSIYSLMCPLRKGRWKVEEEKYTMELLRLIESGVIRLRHGQSIRGFIAKKLHSDDMRVLKKLSNCKMFHFARLINPRMSDAEEIDESIPNVRASLDRLDKLKAEFLRSVQLEALVAVRKYLSDTSIRDLLNARD